MKTEHKRHKKDVNLTLSCASCASCVPFPLALPPGAREAFDPASHLRLSTFDIFWVKPFSEVDLVDGIDRALEIFFVTERKCGIDSHTAFKPCVRCGPFFVTGRQPFLWLEGLANAAGNR